MRSKLMKAAWYMQQGTADEVIQIGQLPVPEPSDKEVRVRLYTSGVNPSDTKVRSGWGGMAQPFSPIIPHQDGAGVIASVGESVATTRIGERVWVYEAQQERPFGTAAEYVVVPESQAIKLPEHVSYETGAALGVPAMTAHRAVFADGAVTGKTVLVTGGAGAVGNMAVQLAKWGGATVFTTVNRPEQADIAKAAGADFVLNYKTEDVVQRIREITGEEQGIDRVVDVNFVSNAAISVSVLKTNGVVALYAGEPEDSINIPLIPLLLRNITLRTILVYAMPQVAKEQAIQDITAMLEVSALSPNIGQCFVLEQVAAAHEAQDSGQLIGKAIVNIV